MNRIQGRFVGMMARNYRAGMLLALTVVLWNPNGGEAQELARMAPDPSASAGEVSPSSSSSAAEPETPSADEEPQIPARDVREPEKTLTGGDLVDAEFPGSWPMFGKTTRMKIGGYVKSDFLYDFDGTIDPYEFLMATIPVEGTPEYAKRGYVSFFSRETRFNIDVRRIEHGRPPLRLFVEGDFWSVGNQFRLRHAYLVVGDFLAGQTWTTLSILESLPVLIDFGAGDALFGGRTTQFRYQRRVGERWKLAAALESLDNMGIEDPFDLVGEPSAALPLLALRGDYKWNSGLVVLGTSFAQLRWDGLSTGPDADALQWDAVIAGRQYLGKDFVCWNLSYGKGSGENIMAFIGSQANAVLTQQGSLETIPAFAAVLSLMHRWSDQFSSNASYAYGWLDTPATRDPLALKRGGIGHVNLLCQLTKEFSTGVEYMWGAQRTTNGALGRANRIQAMARLDF